MCDKWEKELDPATLIRKLVKWYDERDGDPTKSENHGVDVSGRRGGYGHAILGENSCGRRVENSPGILGENSSGIRVANSPGILGENSSGIRVANSRGSQDWECRVSRESSYGGLDIRTNKGDKRGEVRIPPMTYVPPAPATNEDEIFGGGISSGIYFEKFQSVPVMVTGNNIPNAINSFEAACLKKLVLCNIMKSKYSKPTPIQKHAIPIALSGRDILACSQTGSGKTASFLIPIINALLDNPRELLFEDNCAQPQALILTPTRELTLQIFNEARKFSYGSYLKIAVAYGGTAVQHQAGHIAKGCHILVATPGRLRDFVEMGSVSFQSIRFLVLDEADIMLDMDFFPCVQTLIEHPTMVTSNYRQTLMFSATLPVPIQNIADCFLNHYLFIAVGVINGASTEVEQVFCEVAECDKVGLLKNLIFENEGKRVLIFVEKKICADFLACWLSEENIPTTALHGDRDQSEREQALSDFKTGRYCILVATALAARGLDIKNVDIVVNFDLPKRIDQYVHRIGRTGRVGNTGKAISFYDSSKDAALTKDLVKILVQAGQIIPNFFKVDDCSLPRYGGNDIRARAYTANFAGRIPE